MFADKEGPGIATVVTRLWVCMPITGTRGKTGSTGRLKLCSNTGVFTLGDAQSFWADVKNSTIGFNVFFDADVNKTTARHQCENRVWVQRLVQAPRLGI